MRDNGGRRKGFDARAFSYTLHIPENRSGRDRRYDRRECVDRRSQMNRRKMESDENKMPLELGRRLNPDRRCEIERRSQYARSLRIKPGSASGDVC